MLTAFIRKHFPADISLAGLGGRTPPVCIASPSLSQIEALRPIRRCATDAAVIGIAIFGVWSGPMALAGSRPVNVCLQTIYGLNSGVFLSTLLHMPYPNRGVVWRSVQSVFTRLLPR